MTDPGVFERVLMDYGSQIMVAIFRYALKTERYEDCAALKRLFLKYGINVEQSLDDYRAYFWGIGLPGDKAIARLGALLKEAMEEVGYPPDGISIDG